MAMAATTLKRGSLDVDVVHLRRVLDFEVRWKGDWSLALAVRFVPWDAASSDNPGILSRRLFQLIRPNSTLYVKSQVDDENGPYCILVH